MEYIHLASARGPHRPSIVYPAFFMKLVSSWVKWGMYSRRGSLLSPVTQTHWSSHRWKSDIVAFAQDWWQWLATWSIFLRVKAPQSPLNFCGSRLRRARSTFFQFGFHCIPPMCLDIGHDISCFIVTPRRPLCIIFMK